MRMTHGLKRRFSEKVSDEADMNEMAKDPNECKISYQCIVS